MDSMDEHQSEEVDQVEQENSNDVGTGRSYECMFCKRGFTTAQALGGHMNIHRKNRAKTSRPNSSTKHNTEVNNYAGPRIYQPVFSSYPPPYFAAQEAQFRYQTYFPSANSTRLSYDHQNNHNNHSSEQYQYQYQHQHQHQYQHQLISPCGEDLRMGLSLQYGSSYGEDIDQRKSYRVPSYEQDGLDLELRLGHDP